MSMSGDEAVDVKEAAARFCADRIAPHAGRWDAEQALPTSFLSELAEQGWLVPTLPSALGGASLDNAAHMALAEAIGAACQSVRNLMAVQGMVAHAVLRWGPTQSAGSWAERIARGRTLAAFALTEPQGGSDAKRLETEIRQDGDDLVITGQKCWISFATCADVFLVIGRYAENETAAVLVDAASPGVSVEPARDLLGFRASHVGHIRLSECRSPSDRLVARGPLLFQTLVTGALDYGRFSTASGCVGLAQSCLDLSRAFVRRQDRGEGGLERHAVVRGRLADMAMMTDASRLMVGRAAQARDSASPKAALATLAAKLFASDQAARVAAQAVQLHGAGGVGDGSPVQRHFRDSKVNEIIEGANDVLRDQIARML